LDPLDFTNENGSEAVIAIDALDECLDINQLVVALTNIKILSNGNTLLLLMSQPHVDATSLQPWELGL
jgi:hypothetical protein